MVAPAKLDASRRWFAVGDPQASLDRLRAVLGQNGLLAGERLRDDVGLVSIGDHFDYKCGEDEIAQVAENGLMVLRFLARHPADQVVVLAGNHDLSRVMELSHESDASFARARALACAIERAKERGERALDDRARFAEEFPRIPTPEIAHRDYCSFTTAQRAFVEELLVSGRMRLACVGVRGGRPALLTHAGVTARELAMLGLDAPDAAAPTPAAIASALEAALDGAVARVAGAWGRGERAALDLRPLHVAGSTGREGGGLLYHRPSNPERPGADRGWELDAEAPRRFDPRALPRGVVQIAGHSGHPRCVRELGAWVAERAASVPVGCLRTLWSDGARVTYEAAIVETSPLDATLHLIDADMNNPEVADYPLLSLEAVAIPEPASPALRADAG